jgi:ABC-2 type transport system permease protein
LHAFAVLAKAGFRRYSTYRQATVAGTFTNCVFGFLKCFVLLAAAAGGGAIGGYDVPQLVAFVWIGQGLLNTVGLWGDTQLSTRIRSGDVVSDLLRPIHPVASYFATDIGRAGFALMTRFVAPIIVGLIAFPFYVPRRAVTYPLFVLSLMCAIALCFACRYVVNAASFWMLDGRGAQITWVLLSSLLSGLYFPLRFLPGPIAALLWVATPFPSLFQTPLDVAVERAPVPNAFGLVGLQAVWVVLMFWLATAVQRRGERSLVLQGG